MDVSWKLVKMEGRIFLMYGEFRIFGFLDEHEISECATILNKFLEPNREWKEVFREDFRRFCVRHNLSGYIRNVILRAATFPDGKSQIEQIYGYRPTLEQFFDDMDRVAQIRMVGKISIDALEHAWEQEGEHEN
jgi:hypothetical protein